jgi:ribonuclease-3
MTAREDAIRDAREELSRRLAEIVGQGSLPRLEEALTHPSFANESSLPDNQRLEFLGDAVLGLCVSELLGERHPDADEGTLTRMRSALVNAEALARWGRSMNLGACLAMGRGARAGSEQEQTNVIADAVEAMVAAVYSARGLDAARMLVREVVREPLETNGEVLSTRDPKSLLQERVQAGGHAAPSYRTVEVTGPPHDPHFVVEVTAAGEVLARGEGRSKRIAERDAAARALQRPDEDEGAPSGGT